MMQTMAKQYPLRNHLLAALPPKIQARTLPYFQQVKLQQGQVLYQPGEHPEYAYFPIDCIVSLLYVMRNGSVAEIAIVGNDGVVGVALFMGGYSTCNQAVVQSAGSAYRIKKSLFSLEFNLHQEFQHLMLLYTQSLLTQTAQIAVCNCHHNIDQRLCRWLLLSLDRTPGNTLSITQELMAESLDVRREGVTQAAGKLQKLGLIEYHRGVVIILNREGIEDLSCECYAVIKAETDRLLPYSLKKSIANSANADSDGRATR